MLKIVSQLFVCRREGIEVRVVKRGEYDEEVVRWADAIISAGGKNFKVTHLCSHYCFDSLPIHCRDDAINLFLGLLLLLQLPVYINEH